MARRCFQRSVRLKVRPWMLKRVQHDERWMAALHPQAARSSASSRAPLRDPRRRPGSRALENRRCVVTLWAPAFAGDHMGGVGAGACGAPGGHREDCFLVTPDLIRGPCFGRCYGPRIKSGMTKPWEARSVCDRLRPFNPPGAVGMGKGLSYNIRLCQRRSRLFHSVNKRGPRRPSGRRAPATLGGPERGAHKAELS